MKKFTVEYAEQIADLKEALNKMIQTDNEKDAEIERLRELPKQIIALDTKVSYDSDQSPKYMQAYLYLQIRGMAKAALETEAFIVAFKEKAPRN